MKSILKALALLAAAFALVEAGLLFHSARSTLQSADELVADSRQVVLVIQERIDSAGRLLNANLIHSDLILGRAEDATRTWRESTKQQAEYWQKMTESSTEIVGNLDASVLTLNKLLANTDHSLNAELLPQATQTIQNIELLAQEATLQIRDSGVNLQGILAELPPIIHNVENTTDMAYKTMIEIHNMSADIRQSAPKIMGDIESISNRSNKWHPWIMAASLGATIVGVFGFIF